MIARAGSSYLVRVYRSANGHTAGVVGIVELPGQAGTRAFGSAAELCGILFGGGDDVSRFVPDASGADWGAAAVVPETAG